MEKGYRNGKKSQREWAMGAHAAIRKYDMIQAEIVFDEERECGFRDEGGIYIMAGIPSGDGVLPMFVLIDPPIPNPGKFHRGAVIVDGNVVLARQPCETWPAGSSKDYHEKLEGDAWAISLFGMTAYARCHTGECDGMNIDEALEFLKYNTFWDGRIPNYIRRLTELEVPDMAAEPWGAMVQAFQEYRDTRVAMRLVDAVGACWKLANAIPPRKRSTAYPGIQAILVLMGLPKDAMAMGRKCENNSE
jgi:hypothetical protein